MKFTVFSTSHCYDMQGRQFKWPLPGTVKHDAPTPRWASDKRQPWRRRNVHRNMGTPILVRAVINHAMLHYDIFEMENKPIKLRLIIEVHVRWPEVPKSCRIPAWTAHHGSTRRTQSEHSLRLAPIFTEAMLRVVHDGYVASMTFRINDAPRSIVSMAECHPLWPDHELDVVPEHLRWLCPNALNFEHLGVNPNVDPLPD